MRRDTRLVPFDGALDRLRQAVARVPQEATAGDFRTASLSAAGDLDHLRRLREAFRRRRKVRLSYRKAGEEQPSQRVICPYGIVYASGLGGLARAPVRGGSHGARAAEVREAVVRRLEAMGQG